MKVVNVKVREKGARGAGCNQLHNTYILEDYKKLALLFFDLEVHGANIEKAFSEFRKQKKEDWPF